MPRPSGATATASLAWRAKISQLGVAVGLERAVAVEVVLGEVEQHRRLGRERVACPRAGTTTPRRRRSAPGATSPASEASAVPTLPATATGSPASRWMWPISSTVVVLPLEPVTAIELVRQQPPGELELAERRAIPRSRAARDHRRLLRHARALDDACATPASSSTPVVAGVHLDAGRAPARRAASAATRRRRSPTTPRPRARSASAAATPGAGEADDEERAGRQRRARRSRPAFKRPPARRRRGAGTVGRRARRAPRCARRSAFHAASARRPPAARRRVRAGAAALELEALGLEPAADLGGVAERGARRRCRRTSARGGRPASSSRMKRWLSARACRSLPPAARATSP